MPVLNSTVQPRVDIYLAGELRKTLVEYPGFSIVNGGDEADCTLQVKINKWERLPLFFSKEGDSEIIIAKFRVETEICISEHGRNTFTGSVADTFPASLAVEYREDEVLQKISGKLAEKIYFYLLDKI